MCKLFTQLNPQTNTVTEERIVSTHGGTAALRQRLVDGHLVRVTDVRPGELPALVLLKAGVKYGVAIAMGR